MVHGKLRWVILINYIDLASCTVYGTFTPIIFYEYTIIYGTISFITVSMSMNILMNISMYYLICFVGAYWTLFNAI